MSVDATLLQSLVESAPDGMVICDARAADRPVIFVNAAMEKLTGYDASYIRGRNLRFLQGEDHEQDGLEKIRTALRQGVSVHTTLRNYRKDGTMFWNESPAAARDREERSGAEHADHAGLPAGRQAHRAAAPDLLR